jgi:hypothetical protein
MNLIPRVIPVDEEFYLATYEDVKEAIEKGVLKSGAQHFAEHGFFEDRLPMKVIVDEEDYLGRYPDVAKGIVDGAVASGTEHWLKYGRYEGRTAVLQSAHYYRAARG